MVLEPEYYNLVRFPAGKWGGGKSRLRTTLLRHLGVPGGEIGTAGRQFPIMARVDVQTSLQEMMASRPAKRLLRIVSPNHHEVPALAKVLAGGLSPIDAVP